MFTGSKSLKYLRFGALAYELCWNARESRYDIDEYDDGELIGEADDLFTGIPTERDDETAIRVFVEQGTAIISEYGPPQPDWEAQARYDELHGTVNGNDPAVEAWNDAFPYGE